MRSHGIVWASAHTAHEAPASDANDGSVPEPPAHHLATRGQLRGTALAAKGMRDYQFGDLSLGEC